VPTQVIARPKAWVCDHSLVGIAGSNPARVMDVLSVVSFVCVCVCVVR